MSDITGNFSNLRHFEKSRSGVESAMNRLSSGTRITGAKDDAAGLAISDRMNSQVRGLKQAIRNANDGISLVQTAEGALSESTDILQRMNELAIQSGNPIYSGSDRAAMDSEFNQLKSELERIAGTTFFNDQPILDGSMTGGATFQIGSEASDGFTVRIPSMGAESLGVQSLSIDTVQGAQDAITAIGDAIQNIATTRGDLGAAQNRFESTISNLGNVAENTEASRSRIADADIAAEVSSLIKNRILQEAGVSLQTQAKQSAESVLPLLK